MPQQIAVNRNVSIILTPEQLTVVITHLQSGVFKQVSGTISAIEQQIIAQLAPKPEENGNQ